jgi:hypothetical protein
MMIGECHQHSTIVALQAGNHDALLVTWLRAVRDQRNERLACRSQDFHIGWLNDLRIVTI